jgi:hypothetical protein
MVKLVKVCKVLVNEEEEGSLEAMKMEIRKLRAEILGLRSGNGGLLSSVTANLGSRNSVDYGLGSSVASDVPYNLMAMVRQYIDE